MIGFLLFSSLVLFIIGYFTFETNFWISQIFLALSALAFMVIFIKYLPQKEKDNAVDKD